MNLERVLLGDLCGWIGEDSVLGHPDFTEDMSGNMSGVQRYLCGGFVECGEPLVYVYYFLP